MRETFHKDLEAFSDAVVDMTNQVSVALERATHALLDADVTLAETVIDSLGPIQDAYQDLEDKAVDLLAREAPVAGDLRVVVAGLRGVADLERMGSLACHIAEIAQLRHPNHAVPDELRGTVSEMSALGLSMAQKAAAAVASRDVMRARELEVDDDQVDVLRRQLFSRMLSPDWTGGVEPAIDLALAGRYYERFADHAVEVARLVVYMVTGEHPRPDEMRAAD